MFKFDQATVILWKTWDLTSCLQPIYNFLMDINLVSLMSFKFKVSPMMARSFNID